MKLEELKILVTGGAGFIGSHLTDVLLRKNNRVIIYDNFDEYYMGKDRNIRHNLENPNCMLLQHDICDFETLLKSMKGVDVIFHLAAQAGVRYSLKNPVKVNAVNTLGTLNVLNAARKLDVKRVIYASSSSVYGVLKYLPVDEKHPTNPISIYGASKLAAEKYCMAYYHLFHVPIVLLRYYTVYGPRQRPDMAIYKWTKQLFERKPLSIYGNGNQTRDFTYVDDIVEGTIKAAEVEIVKGEIFNLGSGTRISVNNTLKLLGKISGNEDAEIVHEPQKLGDVSDTYADITKARKILGSNPKVCFSDGLNRFINWFKMEDRSKAIAHC